MELPETGVYIALGDKEARTAAARTRSMRNRRKTTNANQIRSQQKTRGCKMQLSLGSTAQRRTTELCHNYPENHLRRNAACYFRNGKKPLKGKAYAPKRRGRQVQGRVCSSTTSGAAPCVHHGEKPSPDLPCCPSCQRATRCAPHG